jgi:uncharacterized membrane protein YjjP (DUF1212 family)
VQTRVEPLEFQLIRSCAEILFTNGQSTKKSVHDLGLVARKLGYASEIIPLWGGISIELYGADYSKPSQTLILNIQPTGVQMNKVKLATLVINQFIAGTLSVEQAIQRIKEVDQSAPCSLIRFIAMSAIGAASLGVIFGIADPRLLLLVMLSAGVGALLRRLTAKVSTNLYSQVLVASIFTGVFGSLAHAYQFSPASVFLFLCPCMILVPGPHLLNGIFDIARGDVGIGQSRLMYAMTITLVICIGLVSSLVFHNQSLTQYEITNDLPFLYYLLAVCGAVAAYGSFFSMSWRDIIIPVFIGAVAFLPRYYLVFVTGYSVVMGVFIASMIAGFLAALLASKTQLPFAALAFSSIVAMIPGSNLFRMADYLFNFYQMGSNASVQESLLALNQGVTAIVIVIAISVGVLIPKLCVDHFLDKKA